MKKLVAILLLGLAPAFAQAQGFVEFGIGQSSVDFGAVPAGVSVDDSDTTWAISGGWMFHPNFGGEIGYRDLGEFSATGPAGTATAELTGIMLGLVVRFPVMDRLSIVPRVGMYLWEGDITGSAVGVPVSDDGSDLYFGIGADFAVTQQLTVGLHFARFDIDGDDVDVIEIKAGFRF